MFSPDWKMNLMYPEKKYLCENYGNNFKLISIIREFYVGGRNRFEILLQTVPHQSLVAPSNEKWEQLESASKAAIDVPWWSPLLILF